MSGPLVDVDTLAARLVAEPDLVLVDVRWTLGGPPGLPEFEAGHLPGASWIDLGSELSGPPGPGGRHPLPDAAVLQAALRRVGIDDTSAVVAYDGGSSLAAARLWWLLTDAGLTDVAVLDGGFAAWRAAGRPIETGPARAVQPGSITVRPGHRPYASVDEVARWLAEGRPVVDVRTAERYRGEHELIDPVGGHIPGAVNRPAAENHLPDGRFRSPAEITARYGDVEEPLLYCGSGITASQTLLALESAGLRGAIYPGSWSEWIADPRRPVATGGDP